MAARGIDLNTLVPRPAGDYPWGRQDRSTRVGAVTVHFGDVASAVEAFIEASPMVVGCVAWVRSRRLVAVLSGRPVALVVNKEFGLRVQGHVEREALAPLVGGVPSGYLPRPRPRAEVLEPVRCAGWAVRGKFGALMHHKFLVRLDETGRAVAVWTGSFNLTAGAEKNIENGMQIDDPQVAEAFLAEFSRVWAISEPLLFSAGTPTPGSNANVPVRVPAARKKRTTVRKAKPAVRKPVAKKTKAKATAKSTVARKAPVRKKAS